jgi:outer membrane protein assembly factor BamB
VFVTGTSFGVSEHDWATVAYDATTGTRLWAKRYNDPLNGGDYASAIGASPDGSQVFVTGRSDGLGYPGYATVAYDAANGSRLWVKTYNGPGTSDTPHALGVSPDGSMVIVTGQSASPPSGESDYATVVYDTSTGAKLWSRRYNGPANGHDFATALGLSPDGSVVFVTGASNRAEYGTSEGFNYATVAYDASTGSQLWAKRYNGPANLEDIASALGVSPDGSKVFVTGHSFGSTSYNDYLTVAYDASTGAKLWSKRYDADNNGDSATAIGVSPDGSEVFVTGGSIGATGVDDYATFAYDASTGARLWSQRYNGPGSSFDDAIDLGVSPDGSKIFVTGTSRGSTSLDDYATVAYAVG